MKKLILALLATLALVAGVPAARAAEGGVAWDKFPTDRVTDLAFAVDGGRLYTASQDSTVRIWDAADANLARVLAPALNGVWSLARSGDGRLLAAGGGKGEVFVYDVVTEAAIDYVGAPLHQGPVERVAFLPAAETPTAFFGTLV